MFGKTNKLCLAKKSDNDVDDAIVKMIEEKLFPVK